MAERSDITVDWGVSPRIITVGAPSVEVTIQDLHDTLNSDTLPAGMSDDSLGNMDDDPIISSAGKEALGGGVFVGISSTLLDAQISFQARTTELQEGTATTAGLKGFSDGAALFQTNLVSRGDLVYNVTDSSQGSVTKVISETQLEIDGLSGGTDNDFDIADVYIIFDVVQCNIAGGNLVAVDVNGDDLDSVFTTFGTQVVRTSASSSTIQGQIDLEHSTFNSEVLINTASGTSGTGYPIGTGRRPVNNLTDAKAIAVARGLSNMRIIGNITLDSGDFSAGYKWYGQSPVVSTITIDTAINLDNCEIHDAYVNGVLDNGNTLIDCLIGNISSYDGHMERCGFNGTITLGGTLQTTLVECYSNIAGTSTPSIDFGGAGSALVMRSYTGGITLDNRTGADEVSIDFLSGQAIVDPTCTAGIITIRGDAKLTDNSTGTCTVIDDTFNFTTTEIASAVRTELTTELANIDATVSSRATQVSVDALATTLAANPEEVWDYLLSNTFAAGSTGEKLKAVLTTGNFLALHK